MAFRKKNVIITDLAKGNEGKISFSLFMTNNNS